MGPAGAMLAPGPAVGLVPPPPPPDRRRAEAEPRRHRGHGFAGLQAAEQAQPPHRGQPDSLVTVH